MNEYANEKFNKAREWIFKKTDEGFSSDEIVHLCVATNIEYREFLRLQNEEKIIPDHMRFDDWGEFVWATINDYPSFTICGIDDGKINDKLTIPSWPGSAWIDYKNSLLGKKTGQPKMSKESVNNLEKNCYWILRHLKRDTMNSNPVKGLVMGSVQSGKTSNMIGLVSMAADYDWNIFIILSGTIESLRRQTQRRFREEFSRCKLLDFHVLDYSSDPDYMTDLETGEEILTDRLQLNSFRDGKPAGNKGQRYVIICLKNSSRLKKLTTWLHSKRSKSERMRILLIDDEADQASINTAKMGDAKDEDDIERTKINGEIINLVNGCNDTNSLSPFQAMNYISYTATPYANVLNEAYPQSLYPSSFICCLEDPSEYFGPKQIFGSSEDEDYSGLNIIRIIPDEELKELKSVYNEESFILPKEFQKSVAWFLCAAAILRKRNYKKPISMLIHTTALQNGHFGEYKSLKNWLERNVKNGNIIKMCERVYAEEKDAFRLENLIEGYPTYAKMDDVCDEFPLFTEIEEEIEVLLSNIINIEMGDDKQPVYKENGIHLCIDNCKANHIADEGTILRLVYPDKQQLSDMKKAPVFIVMGGNTLSRGLTIEGLVCTYFARNVNQVDTLMQMARWFGYRHEYELLQRIWMTENTYKKFETMEEIDELLKQEITDFMDTGKSPSVFAPRVQNSSTIARFLLTSKNKSQNMVAGDLEYAGQSYEVTDYEDSKLDLKHNIDITEKFLEGIGPARKSEAVKSAYVWYDVDSDYVISEFIKKYKIFDCSPLHVDIEIFEEWLRQKNNEGKFLKWDVALAGNSMADDRWIVAGADVGKSSRSRKVNVNHVDIGAMRSGTDILSDVRVSQLSDEKKELFRNGKNDRKMLNRLRYNLGLDDVPLLLLYRFDKNKGKENPGVTTCLGTSEDIVGFSIIIAAQESYKDYVRTVHVNLPD